MKAEMFQPRASEVVYAVLFRDVVEAERETLPEWLPWCHMQCVSSPDSKAVWKITFPVYDGLGSRRYPDIYGELDDWIVMSAITGLLFSVKGSLFDLNFIEYERESEWKVR